MSKHERRVVGHASGWQEQMDTCVCGNPWPCVALTPETKATVSSNERLSQIREHDFPILLEFHSKHALGPLTRPSCLVCGKVPEQWPPAIQHAELPGIVVCHPCRDRATHETLAPSSNGNNALPVGAEDDPLLVWVLERYENCIRLAAQKKGQDRDGWLEDATHFQAVLKRLAAHGNETDERQREIKRLEQVVRLNPAEFDPSVATCPCGVCEYYRKLLREQGTPLDQLGKPNELKAVEQPSPIDDAEFGTAEWRTANPESEGEAR